MDSVHAHVNPPKQSRSKRTLERLVGASLEILGREGPDALTVQAIVERAGSSVGSFYARFAGKEDLLDYLGERVWREAAARWDEALASRDLSGLDLRQLVEPTFSHCRPELPPQWSMTTGAPLPDTS